MYLTMVCASICGVMHLTLSVFHMSNMTQLTLELCTWLCFCAITEKLMTCRYLKRNRVLECPQCKNGITKMDGGCNHIM